ncbi:MAG TPA: hypothetical protein VFW11_18025 [Cyclobacteriaceae bacterium]|nr:hypothetical protein [Cyclobacteriaceae bacterium]
MFISCVENQDKPIDRFALVSRHNVRVTSADTLGSLSVGNGEFAFTVDVSGLQTFYKEYENGISLGTQAQWAWHSIPAEEKYSLNDVAEEYASCNDLQVPYAIQHNDGKAGRATDWLRANPHRLHLGLIGLVITKENGDSVKLDDLQNIDQTLDLWKGKIESNYTIEGNPVKIELYAHPRNDAIAARITSPLIAKDRLRIFFKFPYGKACHVCPGYDFDQPGKHQTEIVNQSDNNITLSRTLDTTKYYVQINSDPSTFKNVASHQYHLIPSRERSSFEFSVAFLKEDSKQEIDFTTTQKQSGEMWEKFWTEGGAMDFSACTDPRARELERRIVLSQYLTRIQGAGSLPPQETGLTFNSWYGKFHLEMHWWHEVQFALWNRIDLLEKSMNWYNEVLQKAKETAQWQGYKGARWQKMTDPYGNESPSGVGAFLIWQQPHPIYYAELLYRQNPELALQKYKDVVFETAAFMASYAHYSATDKHYHLCHPLIPAQEIFHPNETNDPPFELAYWRYALTVAQKWRQRSGLPINEEWQNVIDHLAPYPVKDHLYLPTSGTPDAYIDDQFRRDHPVVTGAYGMLPLTDNMDTSVIANTFDEIMNKWDWPSTWGWDYPMLAMTAARLGKPDKAIDALLMDVQKNTYLVNGHNYQDKRLRIYLPGNGGILTAVAMMAAGWDGCNQKNPGFPKDGTWNVRWEKLEKFP